MRDARNGAAPASPTAAGKDFFSIPWRSQPAQQVLWPLRRPSDVVSPQPRPGALLLVLVLFLAPSALGQTLPTPNPQNDPTLTEPIPKPDFIPGGTSVNASYETEDVTICVEALNTHGDERTTHGPFDVVLHLDGFEEGVFRVRDQLRSGFSAEGCFTFRLDAGVHSYHWVVDAANETDEHREDNNVATQRYFRVYPPPRADLKVEHFDIFPREARDREPQVFRAVIRNVGNLAAGETVLRFSDQTGVIAELPVRALTPGQRDEVAHVTNPQLRPAGSFAAEAAVDINDSIFEWNESNNIRIVAYQIPPHPLPDLALTNLTLEGEPVRGNTLRLNFTVTNDGDFGSRDFRIRVFDNERAIFNTSRGGLGANTSTRVHFLVNIAAGPHALRIVVDPDNLIAEHSELNNDGDVFVNITGGAGAGEAEGVVMVPNLLVERLDAAPNDPRPGEVVTLIAFLRNPTDVRVNETTVEFTVNGEHLGTAPAPALDAGRYASVTLPWPVSAEGSYTIRAFADVAGVVNESDEGDNELSRTFVVVTPPPPTPPKKPETPSNGTGNETAPKPPTTPTQPPPTQQPPLIPTADLEVEVGEINVYPTAVAGGVEGIVVVALRNPQAQDIGGMSVAFKVGGKTIVNKLVDGLPASVTAPVSSGSIQLPAGEQTVVVEVSILGRPGIAATGQKTYSAEAGSDGIPGFGAPLALVAVGVAGALSAYARRRSK